MKKRAPVSEIMSNNPICVNETNSLREVVDQFSKNNIHHMPVVSGSKVVGIISKSDIDRISFITNTTDEKVNTQIYDTLSINQVMTSDVVTVQSSDTIKAAAKKLSTGSYHALPVLEGDDIKGIVTSTDLIKYLVAQY